jgi:7,8-dihydroneopterin aldolase/epimerase/oxygenase
MIQYKKPELILSGLSFNENDTGFSCPFRYKLTENCRTGEYCSVEIDNLALSNTKKMGKILLEGMDFFAYHGHFREEQIIGTKFTIDLEMEFDTGKAETTDQLHDTVNYQEIYLIVKREMEINTHLLERVARRILDSVKQAFPQIKQAKVKISKLNPPLGGKVDRVSCILAE